MQYEQYLLHERQEQQYTATENKKKIIADDINFIKQKIWAMADDFAEKSWSHKKSSVIYEI